MRLNPRSRIVSKQSNIDGEDDERDDGGPSSSRSPKRDEVMWEVGSDSDDDDEGVDKGEGEDSQRRGLGESSGQGRGERRGLLDDDDAERGEAGGAADETADLKKTEADDEEGFGDYQAVQRRESEDREDRNR